MKRFCVAEELNIIHHHTSLQSSNNSSSLQLCSYFMFISWVSWCIIHVVCVANGRSNTGGFFFRVVSPILVALQLLPRQRKCNSTLTGRWLNDLWPRLSNYTCTPTWTPAEVVPPPWYQGGRPRQGGGGQANRKQTWGEVMLGFVTLLLWPFSALYRSNMFKLNSFPWVILCLNFSGLFFYWAFSWTAASYQRCFFLSRCWSFYPYMGFTTLDKTLQFGVTSNESLFLKEDPLFSMAINPKYTLVIILAENSWFLVGR